MQVYRILPLLLAALLLGCSSGATPAAGDVPASPVSETRTVVAVPVSPEPSMTAPAFGAGQPVPLATLKLPANVRAGPGISYSIIGKSKTGARYAITGKSADGKWWQIEFENRPGWIPADFSEVQGGTNAVAVVVVAPAPTATPPPTPAPVRGTVIPRPTSTPLPAPSGNVYFIIQGQTSYVRLDALQEVIQGAALGTPGDLNAMLNTNASPLDWSETGHKLAYVRNDGQQDSLRVDDASGERALDTHSAIVSPRWFGGGTQLAFVGYDNNLQNQAIYVINADGSKPANYTCFAARPREQLRALAVNRRTGDIVFVSNYTGRFELWQVGRSCSGAVQVTHDNADSSAPAFSPDGTRLAFVSNRSAPADYQIYIANADGTSPMALGEGFAPAFSPDGRYLAFARNLEVYIMDTMGHVETPLTPGDKPIWTP